MNEEQMQRAIEFILRSQAESAARSAIIEENFKKMEADHIALREDLRGLAEASLSLTEVSRNLVRVAEIHSRRLDLIEGIQAP